MADTPATTRTRTQARRKTTAPDRSTAAKNAAATRARNRAADTRKRSTAATRAAETRREAPRGPVERSVHYAGKALTIPVGAALVARDNVAGLAAKYSSRDKLERELRARRRRVEAELRRFERRGESARAGVERELRQSRTRVGRDLRALRGNVVATRRDAGARAGLAGARFENLVQTSVTAGTQVAAKVTERVARVV